MNDADRYLLDCLVLISFFERNPRLAEWNTEIYEHAKKVVDDRGRVLAQIFTAAKKSEAT